MAKRAAALALCLFCALPRSAAGAPTATSQPASAPTAATQPGVLGSFPLDANTPIYVPVVIAGKSHIFILDTGATTTVLDPSMRPLLGEPISTESVLLPGGGRQTMEAFAAPDGRIGEISLKAARIVLLHDLSKFSVLCDRDVAGFVGMTLLRDYVVRLDYDRGKLVIHRPDRRPHPEWGEAIDIEFDKHQCPYVYAALPGGLELKLAVDSGVKQTGSLHAAFFDRLVKSGKLRTQPCCAEVMGRVVRSKESRFPSLSVGTIRHQGLILDRDESRSCLGLNFLVRHEVVMDFPNRKMYLRKGKLFDLPCPGGRSGLHVTVREGRLAVLDVEKESPAGRAGLRAGDILLRMDGQRPLIGGVSVTSNRLGEPGRKVTVTVRRNGKELTASFTVAEGI
ncbi:MAG TPA: PDZ domain-containing protein [Phycisphaerae bacterium]|nr:PDZ domain-containing protein [Phycisphaerae bacterium]